MQNHVQKLVDMSETVQLYDNSAHVLLEQLTRYLKQDMKKLSEAKKFKNDAAAVDYKIRLISDIVHIQAAVIKTQSRMITHLEDTSE